VIVKDLAPKYNGVYGSKELCKHY